MNTPKLLAIALLAVPGFAFAQTVGSILGTVQRIFDALIPLLITLAVIYFFWGVAQYILKSDNEEGRREARNIMLYGLIALFVIVGVWGLVGVIAETFGVQTGGSADIPSIR